MRRWPATNVFVDDYRALRVMNFARFDLVKGKKKKKRGKIKQIFRHLIGKWEKEGQKTARIDGIARNENDKYRIE